MSRILAAYTESGHQPDTKRLARDLHELLVFYYDLSAEDLSVETLLETIMDLLATHKLVVPQQLIMLCRAAVMTESIVRTLSPRIYFVIELSPFIKEAIKNRFSLSNVRDELGRLAADGTRAIRALPGALGTFLTNMNDGVSGSNATSRYGAVHASTPPHDDVPCVERDQRFAVSGSVVLWCLPRTVRPVGDGRSHRTHRGCDSDLCDITQNVPTALTREMSHPSHKGTGEVQIAGFARIRELRIGMKALVLGIMAFCVGASGWSGSVPSPAVCVRACPDGAQSAPRQWNGIAPQVKTWELGKRQETLAWFEENQFGKTPVGRLPDEVIGETYVAFTNAGIRIEIHCSLPVGAGAAHPAPVFLFGDHQGGRTPPDFAQGIYGGIPTNSITARGYAYVRWNFNASARTWMRNIHLNGGRLASSPMSRQATGMRRTSFVRRTLGERSARGLGAIRG